MRAHALLTLCAALWLPGCYAHYSWLQVEAGHAASAPAFSEDEQRAAVLAAASVAGRLGLSPSWMQELAPHESRSESRFRELALFQGSGEHRNLLLSVAVRDDAAVLCIWISDLDHSQRTELVRELVRELRDELSRALPDRNIRSGDGRKLRIYAG